MSTRDNTPHDSSMIECGLLPACSRCQGEALPLDSLERMSGRTATRAGSGITPSTIMSPASSIRPSTEIRLGVCFLRVCEPTTFHPRLLRERGPPKRADRSSEAQTGYPALDAWVLYR
jgi:hypothetical protein